MNFCGYSSVGRVWNWVTPVPQKLIQIFDVVIGPCAAAVVVDATILTLFTQWAADKMGIGIGYRPDLLHVISKIDPKLVQFSGVHQGEAFSGDVALETGC